jgi:selenocysteine lyase/cysteine desulfurase
MTGRRLAVHCAMAALAGYERELSRRLLDGLARIEGLRVHGITARDRLHERVPTFALTLPGWQPRELARRLAEANIFTWDGSFYAPEVVDRLGLTQAGGLLRIGLCHYNTADEVDRLCEVLATCVA